MSGKDLVLLAKRISERSVKGEIDTARKIFDEMPHRDCITWNVMLKSYIENHRISDAQDMFERMHEKNTVSWNSMIMAYARERKMHIALKLFSIMPDKDVTSWTTIISGLSRDRQITDAWRLFKLMPEPNSISWSAIISGFQQNGLASKTLILFRQMLSVGIRPTPHSFTSVFTASADVAAHSIGQQLYSQCIKAGFEGNTCVGNSAISMFVKSGNLDFARGISEGLPQPDIITWNSMIVGYGQNGYAVESILVFHQMQKTHFLPDSISFLGVLQGCSHRGLVEEAIQYFKNMKMDYGISPGPEHYACIVDVLSRAGFVKEALMIVMKMPFEPVAIFWRTLLNGCKIWGDLKLGMFAAARVLDLEPHSSSACLMAIEIYSSVGRSADALDMRRRMNQREAKKEISYSWVDINGKVPLFTTRDETHAESENIYNTLELLYYDMQ
ncbi:pentatricopeptide repeat-containing protein At4g02750-like [Papaver somniferum]|uniref:pentatricopeptide repeat-containing protein At4g02750-like n=1 Tax=Papaver somniferum TaxID=3469 RepID=UPI000E70260F|nr:pentatricopeptide repeat-containing protein At4g02750-like [Papaver somniferum]